MLSYASQIQFCDSLVEGVANGHSGEEEGDEQNQHELEGVGAVLCHAVLGYAMLCYAVLRQPDSIL